MLHWVAVCVAVCCAVLRWVAVCCSVLQCVAPLSIVIYVAVCCSVLQCGVLRWVAVCCSVLQCVAPLCIVICDAVCCCILQCPAVPSKFFTVVSIAIQHRTFGNSLQFSSFSFFVQSNLGGFQATLPYITHQCSFFCVQKILRRTCSTLDRGGTQ